MISLPVVVAPFEDTQVHFGQEVMRTNTEAADFGDLFLLCLLFLFCRHLILLQLIL
jgi:hypothetical protein